jgi:hypothetical protein
MLVEPKKFTCAHTVSTARQDDTFVGFVSANDIVIFGLMFDRPCLLSAQQPGCMVEVQQAAALAARLCPTERRTATDVHTTSLRKDWKPIKDFSFLLL